MSPNLYLSKGMDSFKPTEKSNPLTRGGLPVVAGVMGVNKRYPKSKHESKWFKMRNTKLYGFTKASPNMGMQISTMENPHIWMRNSA